MVGSGIKHFKTKIMKTANQNYRAMKTDLHNKLLKITQRNLERRDLRYIRSVMIGREMPGIFFILTANDLNDSEIMNAVCTHGKDFTFFDCGRIAKKVNKVKTGEIEGFLKNK
jgi:hypothetical protein